MSPGLAGTSRTGHPLLWDHITKITKQRDGMVEKLWTILHPLFINYGTKLCKLQVILFCHMLQFYATSCLYAMKFITCFNCVKYFTSLFFFHSFASRYSNPIIYWICAPCFGYLRFIIHLLCTFLFYDMFVFIAL